jgi:hypothetical protein
MLSETASVDHNLHMVKRAGHLCRQVQNATVYIDATDLTAKQRVEKDISHKKLIRQYEANYLDARKMFGKNACRAHFPADKAPGKRNNAATFDTREHCGNLQDLSAGF